MRILEGTQQAYSIQLSRYYKGVEHDDAADSLSAAVETLATSAIVAEYSKALQLLTRAV
jgi:hypothetical protein